MIPDKYPAYIDRRHLRDDPGDPPRQLSGVPATPQPWRGAVGAALLQGLAYRGHCGHKMTVQYHAAPRYLCNDHKMQSGGKECQRLPIDPVDAWVVQNFWESLSPAELDRYDEAIAAFDEHAARSSGLAISSWKRLRYQARLAEKQYRLVDAENRLVAAELERRWEQALQALHQAEAEAANGTGTDAEPMTAELRRQLDEARSDLAADCGTRGR